MVVINKIVYYLIHTQMEILLGNFEKYRVILLIGLFHVASSAQWYTANDGRRYLIEESSSYNWLQALDQCSRQGLQLAVIDSTQKNNALIALLRSVFGGSRDLWIGHHDEFNTKKDKNRMWYSSSTGESISYGYWDSGEPNNKGGEHCAEIYRKSDFRWNDENCDKMYFGYICEEHYKTAQCRSLMESKRSTTKQKNNKLSLDFVRTESNVDKIMDNLRNDTDGVMTQWELTAGSILNNFENSLNQLIAKKPYLQAVIADVGPAIKELASQAHVDLTKLSGETRQSIGEMQLNGQKSINVENLGFADKIQEHSNEMDRMMVY
ncbi:lectin subunit alpha-like [Haematobia irritans]|uniref:lectin subunit alpha-like n=1 Tax=Haematobia irritans TaxID=7368 RepID=UPI003F509D64